MFQSKCVSLLVTCGWTVSHEEEEVMRNLRTLWKTAGQYAFTAIITVSASGNKIFSYYGLIISKLSFIFLFVKCKYTIAITAAERMDKIAT